MYLEVCHWLSEIFDNMSNNINPKNQIRVQQKVKLIEGRPKKLLNNLFSPLSAT